MTSAEHRGLLVSRRSVGLLAVLAGMAATLAGCGGGRASEGVRVTVTPAASVEDQPVHVVVRGLSPHAIVSLNLSSIDAKGVRWISSIRVAASAGGMVDTGRLAPVSGAYRGIWGMGLISMMEPVGPAPAGAYFWGNRQMQFMLTVTAGSKTLASTTFTRRFSTAALTTRYLSVGQTGLVGRFVYPAGERKRPAILLLGGSEGGLPSPLLSGVLAARDYPVLGLAYFKLPGLPHQLRRVPLEYFQGALEWLRRQPEVDPKRIAVLGASRGSEAALLSGAYFPRLVSAVIALVPSDTAICSYPSCDGPLGRFTVAPYLSRFSSTIQTPPTTRRR